MLRGRRAYSPVPPPPIVTDEWSRYWVNDRVYPRRPFIFQPAAGQIDAALQSAPRTAELFYEVEIEPASWEDRKPVRPR